MFLSFVVQNLQPTLRFLDLIKFLCGAFQRGDNIVY